MLGSVYGRSVLDRPPPLLARLHAPARRLRDPSQPRHQVSHRVLIGHRDGHLVTRTLDLSTGGARVPLFPGATAGDHVDITFRQRADPAWFGPCRAQVVHVSERLVGLRFLPSVLQQARIQPHIPASPPLALWQAALQDCLGYYRLFSRRPIPPPATDEQILRAKVAARREGLHLPADYCAFLRVVNGITLGYTHIAGLDVAEGDPSHRLDLFRLNRSLRAGAGPIRLSDMRWPTSPVYNDYPKDDTVFGVYGDDPLWFSHATGLTNSRGLIEPLPLLETLAEHLRIEVLATEDEIDRGWQPQL